MTVSSVVSSDQAVAQPGAATLVSREGDRIVLWLEGEYDIATVSDLEAALTRAIRAYRADLTVDLSGVTFMGTVTIDALIQAGHVLGRQSRRLTVRSPSRCAKRLLTLCGHSDLIEWEGLGNLPHPGETGQWAPRKSAPPVSGGYLRRSAS